MSSPDIPSHSPSIHSISFFRYPFSHHHHHHHHQSLCNTRKASPRERWKNGPYLYLWLGFIIIYAGEIGFGVLSGKRWGEMEGETRIGQVGWRETEREGGVWVEKEKL
jgi:hypothetical protein